MKQKWLTFFKMLYNHNLVLRAYKAPFIIVIILFLVNIAMIAAPGIFAHLQNTHMPDSLDDVDTAFVELYKDEIDCRIEDNRLDCDASYDTYYGDYRFYTTEGLPNVEDIDESAIILGESQAAAVFIENRGEEDEIFRAVGGDYRLLDEFDFSDIRERAEASEDKDAYYEETTNMFLMNLMYADIGQNMLMNYMLQGAQMLLYIVFISALYLLTNFRARIKKVNYTSAFKMAVFAMTGPALVTAVFSLITFLADSALTTWATLFFTMLYLIRVILVYNRINESEKPLY